MKTAIVSYVVTVDATLCLPARRLAIRRASPYFVKGTWHHGVTVELLDAFKKEAIAATGCVKVEESPYWDSYTFVFDSADVAISRSKATMKKCTKFIDKHFVEMTNDQVDVNMDKWG